jgi:signal peptidase I
MDRREYESEDSGDTQIHYRYGQESGVDEPAYGGRDADAGANGSSAPAAGPFEFARWGDDSDPHGETPPAEQSPYRRTAYEQSGTGQHGYDEPEHGEPGSSQPGYGQSGYGPTGYGRTDYGQTDYGQTDYGQTDYGRFPYGEASPATPPFAERPGDPGGYQPSPGESAYGPASEPPAYGQFPRGEEPLGQPGPDYAAEEPEAAGGRGRGGSLVRAVQAWDRPADDDEPSTGALSRVSRRADLVRTGRTGADRDAADRDGEPARRRRSGQGRSMPLWQELPLLLVVAFCLAVLIRTFLLQAFYIPSSSMEETLLVGDRVLVNKIVYDVRQPARGEVIVFAGPSNWTPENPQLVGGGLLSRIGRTLGDLVGVSRPGEKDFIKRVVGVPGDRVSCCDPAGRIYVNGKGLDEPYIHVNSSLDVQPNPRSCSSRRFDEVLVPPGHLFVMGDHRGVSQDSRCQGTVPIENVIGRAFVVVWPSSRWDSLSVPETFADVPPPVALGPLGAAPAAPSGAAAAVTMPILASLVAMARSGRNRRRGVSSTLPT